MEKKGFIFLAGLALIFVALQSVDALTFDCEFRQATACEPADDPWDNIVFKVSGTTNAHGETYTNNNYQYVLCCNFLTSRPPSCSVDGGDTFNNIDNRSIILSAATNAHAESPQKSPVTYGTPVCYGNLECIHQPEPTCYGDYPIDAYSLSDLTNAHIGNFTAYSNFKVCCRNPAEPPAVANCLNSGGVEICISPEVCAGNTISPTTDTPPGVCCDQLCCTPTTCAALGKICGSWSDGCTATPLNCGPASQSCTAVVGTCSVPGTQACNAQGTGYGTCQPLNDPRATCSSLGKNCGTWPDGCGTNLNCGTCGGGEICNNGVCEVCVPESNANACLRTYPGGYECGTATNNCEQQVSCGTCTVPGESCDGGGQCVEGPCVLSTASWNETSVMNDTLVLMSVSGTGGCGGQSVEFTIKENDPVIDDLILTTTNTFPSKTWVAVWTYTQDMYGPGFPAGNDDDLGDDPRDYYFEARLVSGGGTVTSGNLEVNKSTIQPPVCQGITSCGDYTTQSECQADACGKNDTAGVCNGGVCPGPDYETNCRCVWNSTDSICQSAYDIIQCPVTNCGDGIRDAGETCDASDPTDPLNGKSCLDFDEYTGGTLGCDPVTCEYDFTQCTGYVVCNNNNVRETGEACDGSDLDGKSCSNFDEFISGTLSCTNCEFDTSGCTFIPGDGGDGAIGGTCIRTNQVTSECDEGGFYTIQWAGSWSWAVGNEWNSEAECFANTICAAAPECVQEGAKWHCDKSGSRAKCIAGGANIIACPAQIRLPFFGNLQILITLLVIALIYGMMLLDKKGK